jgi:hypothetical protein
MKAWMLRLCRWTALVFALPFLVVIGTHSRTSLPLHDARATRYPMGYCQSGICTLANRPATRPTLGSSSVP